MRTHTHTHTHSRPGSAIGWATAACMQCVHNTKHLSLPPSSALVALQSSPTHSASMRQQACCLMRMHLLQLSHRTSCWLRSAAAVNWGGGANNTQLSQTEINCLTHNCDHFGSHIRAPWFRLTRIRMMDQLQQVPTPYIPLLSRM